MMKGKVFIALCATLLAACDKMPMNGDLDGRWQIMGIQTPDGSRDTKSSRAYLAIQLHLSQWDCGPITYYAHFSHEADSIRFYDFAKASIHSSKADDDLLLTEEEMTGQKLMDVWGIHNLDARYYIRCLDAETLILERNDTILHFRKF